jgi:hypothetical protein
VTASAARVDLVLPGEPVHSPRLERVPTVEAHIVEVARRTRAARLEDQPEVSTTDPAQARAGYLALAAEHADIVVVPPTRLRLPKRLIVRLTRHITHHQVVVNHAVLGALATELPAPPDSSTAAVVAALEVQLEHLQDEVAALQREMRALRQDPSAQPEPDAP